MWSTCPNDFPMHAHHYQTSLTHTQEEIFDMVYIGDLDGVKAKIHNYNSNARNIKGNTILRHALLYNQIEIVRFLLSQGFKFDDIDFIEFQEVIKSYKLEYKTTLDNDFHNIRSLPHSDFKNTEDDQNCNCLLILELIGVIFFEW